MQSIPMLIDTKVHINKEHKLYKNINKPLNNGFMTVILGILAISAILSFIAYTLVLNKEDDLLKLHKTTSVVQMENVNVKTEVEFAKSLYNVEGKAASLAFLHKPDKVIEINLDKVNSSVNFDVAQELEIERVVGGY